MSRNPISQEDKFSHPMSGYKGEVVLFVDNSEECLKLLEHLKGNGVLQKVKVVEVNGIRGWLVLEYGTPRVPLLVTESRVVAGAEEILSYLLGGEAETDER